MLNLSERLGKKAEAWFTGTDINPLLHEKGGIFDEAVLNAFAGNGISSERILNIRQVHGAKILDCDVPPSQKSAEDVPEADGAVTGRSDVFLAVRTADCLPVFLYDEAGKAVALVHAGWRSSKEGIAASAVRQMVRRYSSRPQDIKAVFGPSIHSCCYEVGQEMCMIFPEAMIPRQGKWFLDLQSVNKRQLLDQGVKDDHIVDLKLCTCCGQDFFSYRRQKEEAGRHLSLIRLIER